MIRQIQCGTQSKRPHSVAIISCSRTIAIRRMVITCAYNWNLSQSDVLAWRYRFHSIWDCVKYFDVLIVIDEAWRKYRSPLKKETSSFFSRSCTNISHLVRDSPSGELLVLRSAADAVRIYREGTQIAREILQITQLRRWRWPAHIANHSNDAQRVQKHF